MKVEAFYWFHSACGRQLKHPSSCKAVNAKLPVYVKRGVFFFRKGRANQDLLQDPEHAAPLVKILKNRTSYLELSPLTAKEEPLQQLPGSQFEFGWRYRSNNLTRSPRMVTTVCSAINTRISVYQGILKKCWHSGCISMRQCSDNILVICTMARERGTCPSQGPAL